jgi:hypothetical protein
MGSTTSSRLPNFWSFNIKTTASQTQCSTETSWSFDAFPCPIGLFEYIADLTMLYKLQSDKHKPSQDTLERVNFLASAVQSWNAPESTTSPPKLHLAEAWRSGIILYLMNIFRLEPTQVFDNQVLARTVLEHAKAVPTASIWAYAMSWPLFQAGLTFTTGNLNDREWLRGRLRSMLLAIGCGQFANALRTLEKVWRSYDEGGSPSSVAIHVEEAQLMLA